MGTNSSVKKKVLIITGIIIVFFLFVFFTIFIIKKINNKKEAEEAVAIVVNEGSLVINYLNGNKISTTELNPEYPVSITNMDSNKVYYTIQINDVKTDKNISMIILDEEDNTIYELDKFDETNNVVNLDIIPGNTTKRFKIKLINASDNKVSFNINVINESNTNRIFSDIILLDNTVNKEKTNIGSEIADTNEGLISTKDNDGVSYIFRGNVDNNYFKINDLYFRIIRINGDGSVRIILDEPISTKAAFNTNGIEGEATLESLLDLNTATIKPILDEWYNNNLSDYDSYIVNGSYCIENVFDNLVNNHNYSSVYDRVMVSKKPSLECSNDVTKAKVGLPSIDEVIYAGASKENNTDYYLYNGNSYLTSSILSKNVDNTITIMNVNDTGSIGVGILLNSEYNIRPVINIGMTAKVKGNGTKDNPYIIVA